MVCFRPGSGSPCGVSDSRRGSQCNLHSPGEPEGRPPRPCGGVWWQRARRRYHILRTQIHRGRGVRQYQLCHPLLNTVISFWHTPRIMAYWFFIEPCIGFFLDWSMRMWGTSSWWQFKKHLTTARVSPSKSNCWSWSVWRRRNWWVEE